MAHPTGSCWGTSGPRVDFALPWESRAPGWVQCLGSRVQAQRTGPRRPKPGASDRTRQRKDGTGQVEGRRGAGFGAPWAPCSARSLRLVEERIHRVSSLRATYPLGCTWLGLQIDRSLPETPFSARPG